MIIFKAIGYENKRCYIDDIISEEMSTVIDPVFMLKILEKQDGGILEAWSDGVMLQDFVVYPEYDKPSSNLETISKLKELTN